MGFSAMLADEYILIVPFAYQLQSGPNDESRAKEYIINNINFTHLRFGLTNHGISAQQKALTLCPTLLKLSNSMKKFSKKIFIIATIILIGLTFISYFGAFAEDDGTIENGSALIWLAKMFNILRFATHTHLFGIFFHKTLTYIYSAF